MLIDDIDRQIIASLVEDARRSFAVIGQVVGLSAPAVKRRVDRLVAGGIIRGFTAVVDPDAAGRSVDAFVELHCTSRTTPTDILATVRGIPEVLAAYTITGDADALVHVRTSGTAELEDCLERIRAARIVERTTSVLVLSRLLERSARLGPQPTGGTPAAAGEMGSP